MELPVKFKEQMKRLLQDEYEDYLQSFDHERYYGLRINTLKISVEEFLKISPFKLKPIPWTNDGFYYSSEDKPSKHPYYYAGLYYLQEPSAMLPAQVLPINENDVVLDTCAAPGGKSTKLATKLNHTGLLISNDISSSRCQGLLKNIELFGCDNAWVTSEDLTNMEEHYPETFDKILVDAPCSGEGMIKKHDIALNHWSVENIELCAARQKEILEYAYSMLKPGGTLVYSTCTYALEEDEDVVLSFLEKHEDIQLVDPEVLWGRKGFKDLNVRRIFPMDGGEGHFIAKFKKQSGVAGKLPVLKSKKIDKITEKFLKEQLNTLPNYYYIDNDRVYGMDVCFVDFKKVKVLRQGVYLGDVIKNRFEPSHSFYMVADFDYKRKVEVTLEEMDLFMHGEVLQKECDKGYVAVCYKGHPFGFGKSDGRQIKNKIPKGLRLLPNSHVNID